MSRKTLPQQNCCAIYIYYPIVFYDQIGGPYIEKKVIDRESWDHRFKKIRS